MNCWKCGAQLDLPASGKVPFREICPSCHMALHCCFNCIYYKPGAANDCAIPNVELVVDKEASNFCEEFKIKGEKSSASADVKAAKSKFSSLFRDMHES